VSTSTSRLVSPPKAPDPEEGKTGGESKTKIAEDSYIHTFIHACIYIHIYIYILVSLSHTHTYISEREELASMLPSALPRLPVGRGKEISFLLLYGL
jgi:hypothetical protein